MRQKIKLPQLASSLGILAFSMFVVWFPDVALAAEISVLNRSLEKLYSLLTGDGAKVISGIALAGIGFLTYRGMVPIAILIAFAAGTILIFGSKEIVDWWISR